MSSDTGSESQQIARKATRAVFWNYASFGLGKALVFITIAILARLLTPEDFGVMAFATLAVGYLSIAKDLGLGAALIHRRQDVDEAADTVFTLNFLLGVFLTCATIAVAPYVAIYFDEPRITAILRVLSFTFLLNSLSAIHIVRLQRELAFQRKLIPDLGRSVIKGIVSIGCALLGFGVWSLVFGQLVGVVVATVLAWWAFPWRPRFYINPTLAKALMKYGTPIIGVQALSVVLDNLDYLIVGRVFGNVSLGIYTLAYRLPELLVLNMLWVIAAAIFPAYATIQNQSTILRQGFLATVRYIAMFTVPLCLGLAVAAGPVVRVAFGEQWLDAIPIVRILALFALVSSIGFNVGDVYKATGRPDILVKLSLVHLAIAFPVLWFGAQYSLIGVAMGQLATAMVMMVLRLWVATWVIRVTIGDMLHQLKPSLLSGMVLIVVLLPCLFLTEGISPLFRLVILALVGGVTYTGTLWLLDRESLLQGSQVIGLSSFLRKRKFALNTSTDVEPSVRDL